MNNDNQKQNEILDIQYFINLFIQKWHWFGISLFVALVIAFFINKTSPNIYEVSTSVVINEEGSSLANSSAQLMREIGFLSTSKSFANEMLVLKSTPLIDKAIQSLDFQISYFKINRFLNEELYKSSPFVVILNQDHPQPVYCDFFISVIDSVRFKIYCEQNEVSIMSLTSNKVIQEVENFRFNSVANFGSSITSDKFDFKVILNSNFNLAELKKATYSFRINTHIGLVKSFQTELEVLPPDLESTVAKISLKTSVPQKAIDFLNSLTESYAANDLEKKKFMSVRTIDYINSQLNIVKDSLQIAEQNLQFFRSSNEVVDITVQSGHLFEELTNLENQKAILEVNQKYYTYIQDYFNTKEEYSELIAPSAMGINDPMLNSLIEELIKLNAERSSLVENNQDKSPYLKKINIRIENLKSMVAENINYYKQTNKIALSDLTARINQLNSEVRKLPKTQRELLGFERKFNINDAIYTYLLQKKSEAEIAKASYQSDTEVIEPAEIEGDDSISPNTILNYILAIIIGILMPVIIIRVKNLFVNVIVDIHDIDKITSIPFIGKIYHINQMIENVVEEQPQSMAAESFRRIRAKLNYFLIGNEPKTILINSSISSEGKSFVSINLASALSSSGFKTLLIGFDLRKPRDYKPYALNTGIGITEFLSEQATLDDIIVHTSDPNLDIILSGKVPPNPSELIGSALTERFLKDLKEIYSYIIIDIAPIGVVSDAYLLNEKVDLNIFIVRIKRTPKKIFKELMYEYENRQIKTCLLINDLSQGTGTEKGYGYYK